MKPFAHIVILLTLLIGSAMQAETTEPRDMAKDGVIAAYISTSDVFYLKKNGKVWLDDKQKIRFDHSMNMNIYMGRPYRYVTQVDLEGYSVLDKIDVRRGALYYDGRRISTNRMFVIEIHGAYRWNGGILLHGYTSKLFTGMVFLHENVNELGFLNLATGVCKFSNTYQRGGQMQIGFLAPLPPVNSSNKNFVFDVQVPETVSMGEKFEATISLTNVSDRPLPVPEYLFSGMGIFFCVFTSKPGADDAEKFFAGNYQKNPLALENRASLLGPSQSRSRVHSYVTAWFLKTPGRHRLRFVWNGFLDEGDPKTMSRFECIKWVEVKTPQVHDFGNAFEFDVTIPQRVSRKDDLELSFSIINKTQSPLLVPEYLLGGLTISISFEVFDGSGNRVRNHRNVQYSFKSPERGKASINNRLAPLGPLEKRESSCTAERASWIIYDIPDRYRLVFTWECFMNPDDPDELTRFTVEKWVEVTK